MSFERETERIKSPVLVQCSMKVRWIKTRSLEGKHSIVRRHGRLEKHRSCQLEASWHDSVLPGLRKTLFGLPAFEKRNSCTFGRLASPKEERQNPEAALFWAGSKLQ